MSKHHVIVTHRSGASEQVEARGYATLENLQRGLEKLGFLGDRHLTVRTVEGGWTAVFPVSNFEGGGYIGLYSQHGFHTIG